MYSGGPTSKIPHEKLRTVYVCVKQRKIIYVYLWVYTQYLQKATQ